jgi:hypothetical protein
MKNIVEHYNHRALVKTFKEIKLNWKHKRLIVKRLKTAE